MYVYIYKLFADGEVSTGELSPRTKSCMYLWMFVCMYLCLYVCIFWLLINRVWGLYGKVFARGLREKTESKSLLTKFCIRARVRALGLLSFLYQFVCLFFSSVHLVFSLRLPLRIFKFFFRSYKSFIKRTWNRFVLKSARKFSRQNLPVCTKNLLHDEAANQRASFCIQTA